MNQIKVSEAPILEMDVFRTLKVVLYTLNLMQVAYPPANMPCETIGQAEISPIYV